MSKEELKKAILDTNLVMVDYILDDNILWASNTNILLNHYIDQYLKSNRKKVGIYKITSPSGKVYIGQSIDIDRKWAQYRNKQCSSKLKNSLNKYGVENHLFEIVIECNEEDLDRLEIDYINQYDSINQGLNTNPGGNSNLRGEDNPSFGKSKKLSPEHIEKLRISASKPKSEETKRKISQSKKGIKMGPHSEVTRKKMSQTAKGKKKKEKTMSIEDKREYGKKWYNENIERERQKRREYYNKKKSEKN